MQAGKRSNGSMDMFTDNKDLTHQRCPRPRASPPWVIRTTPPQVNRGGTNLAKGQHKRRK